MLSIKQFKEEFPENKEWNLFIKNNSDGHFFFETDYLFYHKERFEDFSLMLYNKNELICVFPACFVKSSLETSTKAKSLVETLAVVGVSTNDNTPQILYSHKGLTFGGFIFKDNLSFLEKQKCVLACIDFLKSSNTENNFKTVIIKPLPSYFQVATKKDESIHRILNDKLLKGEILKVEANLVIQLPKNKEEYQNNNYKNYSKRKKRNLQKAFKIALKTDLSIEKTDSSIHFWKIIEDNLRNSHQVLPVHSATEIQLLHDKFPKNIAFFVVKKENEILACSVIFIYQTTLHLQYMAATTEGRKTNALDFLIDELVKNYSIYFEKNTNTEVLTYLSLGVSELRNAIVNQNSINEGLFKWKEEFGAQLFSHFIYQISM